MHRWRWKHCFVGGVLLTCTFFSWWMPFHMANLIQRFQPTVHIFGQQEQQSSHQEEPQQNGENTTKTCAWNGRTWKCRQCRVKNGQRVQCRRLKRRRDAATTTAGGRHSCSHPMMLLSNDPRDKNPQVHLYANGDRTLNIRNNKYVYHHQPTCQVGNCWDLSRCRSGMRLVADEDDGAAAASIASSPALTLYINGSASDGWIDYAIKHSKYPLVRVKDYRAACLTIVFPSTYQTFQQLLKVVTLATAIAAATTIY
jgi:hypothetical protein